MHKLTKITPLLKKEIWRKYTEKMTETKGKNKEIFYIKLSLFYRVHYNTIRKIIKRARKGDFSVHLSTIKDNFGWKFKLYLKKEKILSEKTQRKKVCNLNNGGY